MKTIIYLGFNNPNKHKRGVENVIKFQSESAKNYYKYYIFFDDTESKFKWGSIKCIGIKNNNLRFLKLNKLIREIIKKNARKNIVIHSHNYLMSFFLLYKTDIFTVHDGLYYYKKNINSNKLLLFRIIEKIVYYRSNIIHFISNFAKEQSLFNNDSGFVIINNTTPFEEIYTKAKDKFDEFDNTKINIFAVRSIEERARIDLLIETAKLLNKNKYYIYIAGKGPLLKHFKSKAKNIKNITFLGYVDDDDLINYYNNCDLVIMPAEYGEGFGLPIIEGYLFNKPVIASNKCAIPEVIIDKNFLFENNATNIKTKIKEVLKNSYNKKFINFYETNYSYRIISQQYKELYNSLK
ncbi:glycosyltransferase family 4 protein [Halanaerobium sp. MA284_MarDTE_T2]|jgi:glycosyltransferase involved in cell wall biosynthesis|uniref:glycosyltransferase family 4 protein n=1 Tax=Halanaerobium sp. MA284_MarDTE_T2 TaxID=2183913 RepID=UPI000DF326A2|nr:glycosyltransferase family 4 protein [Halanaerobium sp. MA284_MarDTE_T2]RCW44763.1 glycosyltransferase involved in cell wall biosynthesis [Halanaerobium sp. MA284_MarDTE_T2]